MTTTATTETGTGTEGIGTEGTETANMKGIVKGSENVRGREGTGTGREIGIWTTTGKENGRGKGGEASLCTTATLRDALMIMSGRFLLIVSFGLQRKETLFPFTVAGKRSRKAKETPATI